MSHRHFMLPYGLTGWILCPGVRVSQCILPYFGKRKQVTKVTFVVKKKKKKKKSKMRLPFPLTSMENLDVLPNISLSRMSVDT